jgi:very-short-patch-repair endonuclease
MDPLDAINLRLIQERGWIPGSNLENFAARRLSGAFRPTEVSQQHRVGRYRIDFAWTDVKVALEVDGWHHRSPEGAARDSIRDSELRAAGWIVLRVDDRKGRDAMDHQLVRACRIIHGLRAIGDAEEIRRAARQSRAS